IAVGAISGAVGTHATIPPQIEEYVCAELGLGVAPISNQVIQRDRHAHFITTLALLGGSLEKMAQEIRHLQRTELSEAFEPFGSGQQGSSAMPHKRNPELCERVCGLARVLRGFAVTAMENVALWHERDISHSSTERIIFPDGCTLLHYMLHIFTNVMSDLEVNKERMLANLNMTGGLVFSQRILLALIDKGVGRQEAYKMVQRNAKKVWLQYPQNGSEKENQSNASTKAHVQEGVYVTSPKISTHDALADKSDLLPLLVELSKDPEVAQYLSIDELKALTDTGYYTKYIDTAFQRVGL
ncbi:MAG: lyase family protein, partial [Ktedonobacteraceae bacterium]